MYRYRCIDVLYCDGAALCPHNKNWFYGLGFYVFRLCYIFDIPAQIEEVEM